MSFDNANKLGLGTVQFGQKYGIANRAESATSESEVSRILDIALDNQILIIDTASEYGRSEEVLGKVMSQKAEFRVVTKTPRCRESDGKQFVLEAFEKSLGLLRQNSLYGLLVHRSQDLLDEMGSERAQAIRAMKENGKIQKWGVSVYSGEEIDQVLSRYEIDLIQLPLSVLDQRLIQTEHLKRLKDRGVEIHVRSIFLQGLIFLDPDKLDPFFGPLRQSLRRLGDISRELGCTLSHLALAFACGLEEVDAVICGVDTGQQLLELCADSKKEVPVGCTSSLREIAVNNGFVLNPANWNLGVKK